MSDVSNFFVEQEPDSSVQIFNYTSVINEIREEDPDVTYKRQYRKKYVLSDNNELLAAMNFFLGSPNNYIYFGLYNLRTQKKLYSHFRKWVGNNGRVRDVCFTKDSKTMYMVTQNDIHVFDIIKGDRVQQVGTYPIQIGEKMILAAKIDPKEQYLIGVIQLYKQQKTLQRNLVKYNLSNLNDKPIISDNSYGKCLNSDTLIQSPIDFNRTSGTLFSSSKLGYICQWNISNLQPFYEYQLPVATEILPSGEQSKINENAVEVESINVKGDKLFVLDKRHELANVLVYNEGSLSHRQGIQYDIGGQLGDLHMFEVGYSQIYGFYSFDVAQIQFFIPHLQQTKDQVKFIKLNQHMDFVYYNPLSGKIAVLNDGTISQHLMNVTCSDPNQQWASQYGVCFSCHHLPYTIGQDQQDCQCVQGFSFNKLSLKCQINCIQETQNHWRKGKPYCDCPQKPVEMTWNFEDLVCQAKNPDKFPQEKDQPIIIWPIILVLLLLAVVAGVACYFVRKNKNKGEKKSETETDQNKGDLMTDQRITDRPFGKNKQFSQKQSDSNDDEIVSHQKSSYLERRSNKKLVKKCVVCDKSDPDCEGPCLHPYHYSCIVSYLEDEQKLCPQCLKVFHNGLKSIRHFTQ